VPRSKNGWSYTFTPQYVFMALLVVVVVVVVVVVLAAAAAVTI
jgi:hypothetical protein